MFRLMPHCLRALIAALILSCTQPAAAIDPVTLILVRMLRDKILMHLADQAVEEALKAPPKSFAILAPPPGLPPPGLPEAERMRYIVDRNFTYLSGAQRDQVHQGLMTALNDPANHASRAEMIDEFTRTALAVGEAQRILDKLSWSQKRDIAVSAGSAYRQLPADERLELLTMLRSGQAPIPQDLTTLLLAEMEGR